LGLFAFATNESSKTVAYRGQVIDDPEAYAIYASLLPEDSWVKRVHPHVILQRETVMDIHCTFPRETQQELLLRYLPDEWRPANRPHDAWRSVIEHFRMENAATRVLRPSPMNVSYELAERSKLERVMSEARVWKGAFEAAYPGAQGYLALSAIGFNEQKTRAIVYLEHHCGPRCAGGTNEGLEKHGGRWRQVKVNCVWTT